MTIAINQYVFKTAWTGFLRSLANQYHCKVVYGGQPRTDGKTIWLPQLPIELDPDDVFLVMALGHHEISHCKYTSFGYGKSFSSMYGKPAFRLLNALEDVRIEILHTKVSRSATNYLRDLPVKLLQKGRFRSGEGNTAEAFNAYCLCYLQSQRWNTYEAPADIAKQNFIEAFGDGAEKILAQTTALLDEEFPHCKSTKDVGELTLAIRKLLQDEADEPADGDPEKGDPEPDDSEDGGEPDKGEQKSEPKDDDGDPENGEQEPEKSEDESEPENGDQELDDGKVDSEETDPENEEGSDDDNQSNGDDPADTVDEPNDGDSTDEQSESDGGDNQDDLGERIEQLLSEDPGEQEVFDVTEAVKQLAEDIEDGKRPEYAQLPVVPSSDFLPSFGGADKGGVDGDSVIAPMDADATNLVMESLSSEARILGGYLQQMLTSTEEANIHIGRRGSLMTQRVYRAGMGDSNLFAQVDEEESINTSVFMLNDLSGSTQGGCDFAIQQATLILSQALDMADVPFEIAGFGHREGSLMAEIKGFDERYFFAKNRIGGSSQLVGGGTPLTEAVFEAGNRFSARSENRKVMYILTDGDPWEPVSCAEQINYLRSKGMEIHVLLLGSCYDPSWLLNNDIPHVEIHDVSVLPSVLLKQMQQSLLR